MLRFERAVQAWHGWDFTPLVWRFEAALDAGGERREAQDDDRRKRAAHPRHVLGPPRGGIELVRLLERERREDEAAHMAEAIRIHTAVTGERPLGWYTGRSSPNTLQLAAEEGGFLYCADSYADDLPYWARVGGRSQLVVPYTLDTNDMRFATAQGFNSGRREPHVVGIQRVGHDKLRPAADTRPIGQIVGVGVGAVEEAAFLGDQSQRVGAAPDCVHQAGVN